MGEETTKNMAPPALPLASKRNNADQQQHSDSKLATAIISTSAIDKRAAEPTANSVNSKKVKSSLKLSSKHQTKLSSIANSPSSSSIVLNDYNINNHPRNHRKDLFNARKPSNNNNKEYISYYEAAAAAAAASGLFRKSISSSGLVGSETNKRPSSPNGSAFLVSTASAATASSFYPYDHHLASLATGLNLSRRYSSPNNSSPSSSYLSTTNCHQNVCLSNIDNNERNSNGNGFRNSASHQPLVKL